MGGFSCLKAFGDFVPSRERFCMVSILIDSHAADGVRQICAICQNAVFPPKKPGNEKLIPGKMNHIPK
jgi:hypothetical protein